MCQKLFIDLQTVFDRLSLSVVQNAYLGTSVTAG